VRVLGQALLGIGLVAAVFGVLLLEDLVGLAENRTGLDTFGAFLIGLGYTALFATPGILVALVGWGLVRQVGPATEERSPPSWGSVRTFVSLFIVGIALQCVGGVVLAVGLVFGGGLADSCENGCTDMWVVRTVFAVPGR